MRKTLWDVGYERLWSGKHSWSLWLRIALCLVSPALIGCFSEREGTAPVEGVCSVELGEGLPGSTVVLMRRFAFEPAEVRVSPGERVTWINCDPDEHTSTADNGQWASPLLASAAVFTATFPSPGDFPYHCEPHPFMTGRIIVE
ncbi:MAG TPA: cupredoxin family copper-binding protein [Gemmatimonadales bacterium]|nr:cupredoxin family copper-binding protein [Gemmatimonadales bacterium]